MTDKQIMQGGRGSAKPFTTLNSIMLNLKANKYKEALQKINRIIIGKLAWTCLPTKTEEQILQVISEVLDE